MGGGERAPAVRRHRHSPDPDERREGRDIVAVSAMRSMLLPCSHRATRQASLVSGGSGVAAMSRIRPVLAGAIAVSCRMTRGCLWRFGEHGSKYTAYRHCGLPQDRARERQFDKQAVSLGRCRKSVQIARRYIRQGAHCAITRG